MRIGVSAPCHREERELNGMKLISYRQNGRETVGVLTAGEERVLPIVKAGLPFQTMNELITCATENQLHRLALAAVRGEEEGVLYAEVEKLSPIPRPMQDVLCLGINYMDHAEESARYKKETFTGDRPYAVYFSKRVNTAVPDGGRIDGHFDLHDTLDYEVELAVILGRDAKHIRAQDAEAYVFGYTILNDVSARSLQTRHKQFYFAKSLDGFTPMGPWIVTKDELPFPPALEIQSRVNGELRQNSNTDRLIFGIPQVLEELSAGMTLKAGTIIAMGTPAGVGMGFDPPRFLSSGDVVSCSIEGIGTLTNTVG